jgi:hypothetical protein
MLYLTYLSTTSREAGRYVFPFFSSLPEGKTGMKMIDACALTCSGMLRKRANKSSELEVINKNYVYQKSKT